MAIVLVAGARKSNRLSELVNWQASWYSTDLDH